MLKKILKSYDYSLIIVMVLLSIFGLIMVYSASMVSAVQRYDLPSSDYFYKKQLSHLVVAGFVFIVAALFPYKAFLSNRLLVPMVFLSLIGLLGLFVLGHVAGNAQSWYEIGNSKLQPAEFVKLAVIIYLSAVYAKKQSYINEFNKGVAPPIVYLLLVCGLVTIQPDFGTAAIIFLIGATVIVCSGMNFRNLLRLATIAAVVLIPFVLIFSKDLFSDEKRERIFVFLDSPFKNEADANYQMANSLIAIGGGGLKGLGLGQGVQKLGYLTDGHTDFIIAVIAEELGIYGVVFVIACLSYIVLRGIYIGLRCKDSFGSLLAIGISSMIGIQSFINIGGVSRIIPLTGVPLPFVSYGGSSLVQLALSMGILVNVSMFVKYEKKYKNKEEKVVSELPKQSRNRFLHNR
ncbi:FtsW/RodA/SpoVE family cell cycle protein [Niallia sp. 01092]|uniref:FtsW/RodA/SpoVE family cell cycle protein n=1 Tax=unclassified Niallia TaxID=2837522 RepID=UPI003FCF79FD